MIDLINDLLKVEGFQTRIHLKRNSNTITIPNKQVTVEKLTTRYGDCAVFKDNKNAVVAVIVISEIASVITVH